MPTRNPYEEAKVTYPVKELLEEIKKELRELNERVAVLEKESAQKQGGSIFREASSRLIFGLVGMAAGVSAIVLGILNVVL